MPGLIIHTYAIDVNSAVLVLYADIASPAPVPFQKANEHVEVGALIQGAPAVERTHLGSAFVEYLKSGSIQLPIRPHRIRALFFDDW